MNTTSNRVYGLDILKALCAFCVIIIHAPFFGKIDDYIDALCRIAVPVFFLITGYFYTDAQRQKRELAQIKKIFLLCFFSYVLYFLWGLFLACLSGQIKPFFIQIIRMKSLLKFFVFNEPPFFEHLWYLSAILYVLILVYFLNRVFPKDSSKILLIVTPFLLLVNLLFGNYSLLLLQRGYPCIFTRNFLCVGIPYFTIGFFLRKHRKVIAEFRAKRAFLVSLTLFFALTAILEVYLLKRFGLLAEKEHYISTIFLSILVFSVFTSPYWNGKMPFLYHIGRKYSTYIYIFHPIVITILNAIARRLPANKYYTYYRPAAVYFISILISILYVRVQSFLGSKFGKHLSVRE